jgi:hypothetical protein
MFGVAKGLELRRKRQWIFIFTGFLSGFLLGLNLSVNWINSLLFGFLTSLLIVYTGLSLQVVKRWAGKNKQYKKHIDDN